MCPRVDKLFYNDFFAWLSSITDSLLDNLNAIPQHVRRILKIRLKVCKDVILLQLNLGFHELNEFIIVFVILSPN